MEDFKVIEFKIDNRVGEITLNRPDKRNALNPQMVIELTHAFEKCATDESVKIILLKANGDAFCAGADLAVLKAMKKATYQENMADSSRLAKLFRTIYTNPKPVIAKVHGHAIAGGCGLVSVCDIALASDEAKFGYTETRIGFVPAIVAQFLIRKVGQTQARNLLLTGKLIDASTAEKIGVVTETVNHSELDQRVEALINDLLNKTSGQALQSTKKLINTVSDFKFEEAIQFAVRLNAESRGTEDCQKGISAFLNKEKPVW